MNKLTLGTAQIIRNHTDQIVLTYMNHGSFLIGERLYSNVIDATEFCKERDLRIIDVHA